MGISRSSNYFSVVLDVREQPLLCAIGGLMTNAEKDLRLAKEYVLKKHPKNESILEWVRRHRMTETELDYLAGRESMREEVKVLREALEKTAKLRGHYERSDSYEANKVKIATEALEKVGE